MLRMLAIVLLAGATLGAVAAARRDTGAEPSPPNEAVDVLDEIVVTSERTGPGLWHVHRAGGEVWILGTVSPLPKGMGWRSAQFEQVLSRAHTVLLAKPLGIGVARALWIYITHRDLLMVPDGRRLRDVMPPALHARFAAQRANYTADPEKWERFRPLVAAAFLQEAALHKVGLSTHLDIGSEVRALARKHDVDVEELKIAGVRDLLETLKALPNSTELTCVAAALSTIETGLPRLVERANAWAGGDVERMQSLPDSAEDLACRAAVSTGSGSAELIAQVRRAWLSAIKEGVDRGGTTVAVVNIEVLFEKGGVLDLLRAQGYEVEAP